MYYITDLSADASVTISLIHKDKNNKKEYYTTWELSHEDAMRFNEDYWFRSSDVSKEEIEEVVKSMFEDYASMVMNSHSVCNMTMSIHDENLNDYQDYKSRDDYEDEELLQSILEEENVVFLDELSWGVICEISCCVDEYELDTSL